MLIQYNPNTHFLSIDGHANFAENGKDILCSAISTLTDTLYLALTKNGIQFDYEEDMASGHKVFKPKTVTMLNISIDRAKTYNLVLNTIYNTVVDGLEAISSAYSDYITFKILSKN